jgi:hypothetical protein
MNPVLIALRNYNEQWTVVALLASFAFCFGWVRPRFGSLVSLLFLASIGSAIMVWLPDNNRYAPIEPYLQTNLKLFACEAAAKIMIVLLPFMLFVERRARYRYYGEIAARWFVILNAAWICVSALQGCRALENSCSGIIGNPSICVGLMVAMLPIFIGDWRDDWWVLGLTALAVFLSKSSIGVGLLAVYGLVAFSRKNLHLGLGFFGAVFGVGAWLLKKQLFHDSDRFRTWSFIMHRWPTPQNLAFGTGLGTYHVWSMDLQEYGFHQYPNSFIGTQYWWNTLHNEFLQFFFECGLVSGLLFLAVYLLALKRSFFSDQGLFLSVLLFGCYMFLDPALHQPLPALFGAWLFTLALRQPNLTEETL